MRAKINKTIKRDFNPRSHERSDQEQIAAASGDVNISIHAPTRGATGL